MEIIRSLLFVPADSQKKIEKARSLRPDGLMLDLEDGVAPGNKLLARTVLSSELERLVEVPTKILVRVNSFQTQLLQDDLRIAVVPAVHGIVLPKSEDESEIGHADEVITRLEQKNGLTVGQTRLLLMIEGPVGVVNAYSLACSSRRVRALIFGAEDYGAEMVVSRTKSGEEIAYARSVIAHAARAAGLEAIDTVFKDLTDDAGFLEETRRVKQMGFTGKLLIHPRQINLVHKGFAPQKHEIVWAERVIEAFEAAQQESSGLAVVDGQMVDRPIVLQAKRILQHKEDRL